LVLVYVISADKYAKCAKKLQAVLQIQAPNAPPFCDILAEAPVCRLCREAWLPGWVRSQVYEMEGRPMAETIVTVKLNQQQKELLDRTVATGVAADRIGLIRLALRQYAERHGAEA